MAIIARNFTMIEVVLEEFYCSKPSYSLEAALRHDHEILGMLPISGSQSRRWVSNVFLLTCWIPVGEMKLRNGPRYEDDAIPTINCLMNLAVHMDFDVPEIIRENIRFIIASASYPIFRYLSGQFGFIRSLSNPYPASTKQWILYPGAFSEYINKAECLMYAIPYCQRDIFKYLVEGFGVSLESTCTIDGVYLYPRLVAAGYSNLLLSNIMRINN